MSFIFLSCREKVHNNKEFSDKISKSCIQTVDYKKKKKITNLATFQLPLN